MPIAPQRKGVPKREHQCRVPMKGQVYRHPKTSSIDPKAPMYQQDTRAFEGIPVSREGIERWIRENGVTMV